MSHPQQLMIPPLRRRQDRLVPLPQPAKASIDPQIQTHIPESNTLPQPPISPQSGPPNLLTLPDEVVTEIAHFLRLPTNHSVKPTALIPLSLTCRRLSRLVQPVIWSIIRTVNDEDNVILFETLARDPSVIPFIKRFRFALPAPPNPYLPVIFAFPFALTSFTIGDCSSWNPFPKTITDFVRRCPLRDLRTYGHLHPLEDKEFNISEALPELRELAVADGDEHFRFIKVPRLEILRSYPEAGLPDFSIKLIVGALGTVRSLLIMSREPEDVPPPLLPQKLADEVALLAATSMNENVAPNLRTLVIDNFTVFPTDPGEGGILPLLRALSGTRLHTVRLRFFEQMLDMENAPLWNKLRMDSVRVLGLQGPASYFSLVAMQAVTTIVRSFPNLKRLHLLQWDEPGIKTPELASVSEVELALKHGALYAFMAILEKSTHVVEFVFDDLYCVRRRTDEKFSIQVVWRDMENQRVDDDHK